MDRCSDDPVRLMYVLPAELFGGAERQGVLHISKLGDHGFEVLPVVGPGTPIRRALADEGVEDYLFLEHLCHEAYYPLTGLGRLRFGTQFVRDWVNTQRSLLKLAMRRGVDLIFANRSTGWIGGSFVARMLDVPLVWRGGSRLTQRTEASALGVLSRFARPDLFLANCEAVRADLAPMVDCPTRILRNGVDTRRFDPSRVRPRIREELGLGADVPIVGFPSRPAPEKGMELLAKVAELTARQIPNVRFLVAGEFGWRSHYEKAFAAQGLGDRIRFLGHMDQVEIFLGSCDAVVLTSKAHSIEGSPNALLEAMAMERPVVATQVGGVGEAVTDGVEGFLTREDDAGAFARRLTELLRDHVLRRRMGAAGRAAILERYHHEKVVGELAGVLHSLVRASRASTGRNRLRAYVQSSMSRRAAGRP
jgi:glycosyltransferase involved in cell wall biosynthesis